MSTPSQQTAKDKESQLLVEALEALLINTQNLEKRIREDAKIQKIKCHLCKHKDFSVHLIPPNEENDPGVIGILECDNCDESYTVFKPKHEEWHSS